MRILMVTSFPIPGQFDGTAMLPIKIMRALKVRGVQVVMAYLRARPPWRTTSALGEFEGTPLYTIPPAGWASGLGLKRIARELRFDLVHAQHYGGATRVYPACRRYRWPMVYEVHSLLGDEVERERLGRGLVFRTYRAIEQRVFRHAAAVIALGEPVKRVVIEEKGVPEDRVRVIYPGIDLGEYESPSAPIVIPGVGPEHRVIMYVGSIVHPNQGVPILIDALPRIFAAQPEARCVLACRENFSVQSKIAVYLAAGRPIVATDFGDYQQLLGTTGAGLLTPVEPGPLADAIVRVLSEPALAASLAAATGPVAREYFAMDRNIDRYIDVYQDAIAAGPR
jgi:D-inositol-3-phosphate glycosyltransferase